MPDAWTLSNMQRTSAAIFMVDILHPEIIGTTIANIRNYSVNMN